jgi:hypothetical protein
MPKVKVNDISMYYEVHGKGEPLVLINGAGASIETFYWLIPIYSRDYRLVLFDNRGVGQTDRPDMIYTTQLMADDLAGLLDAIGIDSAHMHVTSMGGMIAQEFACCCFFSLEKSKERSNSISPFPSTPLSCRRDRCEDGTRFFCINFCR